MRGYITISLFTLFAFSCKKTARTSGPTSVQGQVVDQSSGKGIYDAMVGLMQQPKDAVGALGMKQIAGVSSDRNGNFSFNFNYDDNYSYEVRASANYYYENSGGGTSLSAGSNNNVKVRLVPKGYVKFLLHNVPPLDTATIIISLDGVPEIPSIHRDTTLFGWGTGNNREIFLHTIGKASTGYLTYHDSVFVRSLDTVNYSINY